MSYYGLTLAGLLHDIGKFAQRAESNPQRLAPGYEGFSNEDFGANGIHATWSAAYISHFIPMMSDLSSVLYHHRPNTPDAQRIALADQLASGEHASTNEKQPRYLMSIFAQLGSQRPAPAYVPLQPLSLEALDPARLTPENALPDDKSAYQALWEAFTQESETLRDLDDVPILVNALYYLMERYTWSIPTAFYRDTPDISLFDHSRVTAAVAACLADLDDETIATLLDSNNKGKPDQSIPVAYLLEGDISGVQNFIYTITARGAVQALRGRSFYLQLLTEAIARYILRWLNLPITNLIYAGGGHFYLLIPASGYRGLDAMQQTLDRILLHYHQGDLYVALGAAKLTCQDFHLDHFSNKWRESGEEVGRKKRRRFAALDTDELGSLFTPQGHGGNEDQDCQVCHYQGADVQVENRDDDDTPIRKCALCRSLEQLGKDIRNAPQLALLEIEPTSATHQREWTTVLAAFGMSIGIQTEYGWRFSLPNDVPINAAMLFGLRDFPALTDQRQLEKQLGCPSVRGLRLTVNVTPYNPDGNRATFEDLQDAAAGIQRLGVLRMDVDDLGHLFSQGFRRDHENLSTLARVAGLSSSLSRYFEGWVGKLCQDINTRQWDQGKSEAIYTIYSGGDDLFIVGAWSFLPTLAQQISTDFGHYALHNPVVHLSGGLTLHGGKEPLYQGAEAAHQALDSAKDLPGKNAFTMFDLSFHWHEFTQVNEIRQELEILVDMLKNRRLLQLLIGLYEQYEETAQRQREQGLGYTRDGRPQIVWGPYMWRGVYQLKRLADRAGSSQRETIMNISHRLQDNNFTQIRLYGLAARWAEAHTRQA